MLHRSMSGDPAKINPISPTGREHRIRLSFIIPKESRRRMFAEVRRRHGRARRERRLAEMRFWMEPRNGRDETLVRCDIRPG